MSIKFGSIEIDEEIVMRQLKQDLKDDWFPDPRRFEDVFTQSLIQKILSGNFQINHGIYKPSKRHALNIPKSNFTLRSALETSISDRLLYHALGASLVPLYDPLMPWQVFSHRFNGGELAEKHLFRPGVQSWTAFVGVVRAELELSETSVLLSTDLTNYFDNIDISRLKKEMEKFISELDASAAEKAEVRSRIETLFQCLGDWCYSTSSGLPQNRDASSFLANMYMLSVDRAMLNKGYKYFRYMDDIKIICTDIYHARKALKELSIELRQIGLSVNSKKTVICNPGDTVEVGKCLDTVGSELLELDAIWKTRKAETISRSFPALRDLTIKQLKNDAVDSREFRFCIARLETLALCNEFAVPNAYFDVITSHIIDALVKFPAATDQLTRYIRAVPTSSADLEKIGDLIMDSNKNIYKWQSYRLWILLAQKNFRSEPLLKYAESIVSQQIDDPMRCGATMYLGAIGGLDERVFISKHFRTLNTFMGQRNALIAMQELKYKEHIIDDVQPFVRDDLKGVWRGLGREGLYFAPPERKSISWLVDGERDYD